MHRHCDRGVGSELVTAVGGDLIEGRDSIEGVPEAAHIGSIGTHVTGSEAVPAIILPGEDLGEEEGDVHPGAEEPDGRVALQEDDLDPGLAGLPLAYLPLSSWSRTMRELTCANLSSPRYHAVKRSSAYAF